MIIVFEGPDGCGKSYASKHIAAKYNLQLKGSRRPSGKPDMANYLAEFDDLIESREYILTDRAPFISEFVYARAFDNPLLAPADVLLSYWERISLVIYCRTRQPRISKEFKPHKPEEYRKEVERRAAVIRKGYDMIFSRDNLPFPVYSYDTFQQGSLDRLCKYLEDNKYV